MQFLENQIPVKHLQPTHSSDPKIRFRDFQFTELKVFERVNTCTFFLAKDKEKGGGGGGVTFHAKHEALPKQLSCFLLFCCFFLYSTQNNTVPTLFLIQSHFLFILPTALRITQQLY